MNRKQPVFLRAISLTALLAAAISASAQGAADPSGAKRVVELDRVIAVVNDDVITETELRRRMEHTKKQLAVEGITVPPDAVLRRQLLERMSIERIQLQIAARQGIKALESDVDKLIDRLAARNNVSPEAFLQRLDQEGISRAGYRAELLDQLTIQRLLEREIGNRIIVSDAEINLFLENADKTGGSDAEFSIAHIFIIVPEAATPDAIAQAKRHAEQVRREIVDGESFERAAVTYSQGSDALKGGVLGWRKAGQLPDLFIQAIKPLNTGEITEVLRGPNGFHIVKLIDRRGGEQGASVTQTQARHILLRPSEIQSAAEARNKLQVLRERVVNGEDFAALARAHSEDAVSAANGGELGWVNPKQLVPEFERVMDALKPGELSQPVETPFGVHLIQVIDRRVRDVTEERQRAAARQQIHARKADERYEQWVRQLRDEAFVEYYLEDVN